MQVDALKGENRDMGASSALASSKAAEAEAKLGDAERTIAALREEIKSQREQVSRQEIPVFILYLSFITARSMALTAYGQCSGPGIWCSCVDRCESVMCA